MLLDVSLATFKRKQQELKYSYKVTHEVLYMQSFVDI